jgi:hypothetical protein
MKYIKKPVIVEAIQWCGGNHREMYDFLEGKPEKHMDSIGKNFYMNNQGVLVIKTLEGDHQAHVGDYIIKGIQGEFYPCKPDIFHATYEPVS